MRRLSLGMLLLAGLFLGWAAGASAAPFAYITNFGSDDVSIIDTATDTVIGTVPVGVDPVGVAVHPDGTFVYVGNKRSNTVSVIDTATNTVVDTVTGGFDDSGGVAVNPAGTRVYVTNSDSGTVSVINTATNTVIATVPVGTGPEGIAVHPAGTFVYVANVSSGTISVISTATNTVIATVAVGLDPRGVAVHPDGTFVYVANENSNNVSVINTTTNTVIKTVLVGLDPFGVAVHPDGTRVYVANESSDTVSVIDTATNNVISTVVVGDGPLAFGQFIGPCPATAALEGDPQKETKLGILRDFRDEVLANTPTGQRYIELFYKHAVEGVELMLSYPELLSHTYTLLERFLPTLQAVVAGLEVTMTVADLADIDALLEEVAAKASPELQADLRAIREELWQGTLLEQFGIVVR